MIPKVKTWRVRLWNLLGREIGCVDVPAINRRFALWAARDAVGWDLWSCAQRVTAAPWRP